MPETVGTLCDKLTIVKLKQYHTESQERLASLQHQSLQLQRELDTLISDALSGEIPRERLSFPSNKVFKKQAFDLSINGGSIGQVFAELAAVNCDLWHQQEKVYDFEKVPIAEKDSVVRSLAELNLKRNLCIDAIDRSFCEILESIHQK